MLTSATIPQSFCEYRLDFLPLLQRNLRSAAALIMPDISGSNIPTLMVRTYNAFSRDELAGVV